MLGKTHYSKFINRKCYPILHEINRRKTIISVIGQKLIWCNHIKQIGIFRVSVYFILTQKLTYY